MTEKLTWHCSECGEPIEDGTGYLHFRNEEMLAHFDADFGYWAAKMVDGIDRKLHTVPRASWLFTHRKCDADAAALNTRYAIADTRSWADLFEIVADTLKKPYAGHTALVEFLYEVLSLQKYPNRVGSMAIHPIDLIDPDTRGPVGS